MATALAAASLVATVLGHTALGGEAAAQSSEHSTDPLWEAFSNPPAEARPFVRWWWNGLRVEEQEIRRELDLLKEAGFGGVEINPIALPEGSVLHDEPELTWLSDEWRQTVRFTVEQAQRRGMIVDIIVGSGWPFGSEFLKPDQWTQRLSTGVADVVGPAQITLSRRELLSKVRPEKKRGWDKAPPPEIAFLSLAPANLRSIEDFRDVSREFNGEALVLKVPPGEHLLHIGVHARGFSQVHLGARGAKGPVLDHYNAAAVGDFLGKMSPTLTPLQSGRVGGEIRAVFCDSIELSKANWTDDFAVEFQQRAGYDVRPWLPLIVDFEDPPAVAPLLAESVCRVRYDYCRVIVELYRERFIRTFHEWCRSNGALSRYQAYGTPWLPGLLDGYLETDIPEGNNWIHRRGQSLSNSPGIRNHGFLVWSKYAASAGHLAGRRTVSTEAHTNLRAVFQLDLESLKIADDLNFIMGVNHSVLHGFNYSPREAGFPGWIRYGAYFSEQNTWWKYMTQWSDYNARLSAVFQATRPVAPVAVMAPRSDIWRRSGLRRGGFHREPFYAHELWETLSNYGVPSDYINETILSGATVKDGRLCYGPAAYDAIVLAGVQSLEPESAETLLEFVDAGGRLILVEHEPSRSPGLYNASENDQRVRQAIRAIPRSGGGVTQLAAPPTHAELLDWTAGLIDAIDLPRELAIESPSASVFVTQRESADGRPLYFFANQSGENSRIELHSRVSGTPWRWDPERGARIPLRLGDSLTLGPYESLLIVFEEEPGSQAPPLGPTSDAPAQEIAGPWNVRFIPHTGEPFERTQRALGDLGQSSDAALNTFAGTAVYKTSFSVDGAPPKRIDLGSVYDISEVRLNGQPLGVRWYGRHSYDLEGLVQQSDNQLEIKVTTVLFNYARTLRDNPAAARWISDQASEDTVPAGLAGPVMLIRE